MALKSTFGVGRSPSTLGIFPLVAIAGVTLHKVVHFRPSVHFRSRPSEIPRFSCGNLWSAQLQIDSILRRS